MKHLLFFVIVFYFISARGQLPDLKLSSTHIRVSGEKGGFLLVPASELANPPPRFLLFLRLKEGSFEVLGRGQVVALQDGNLLLEIDKGTLLKMPLVGDLAVPLAPPKEFPNLPELVATSSAKNELENEVPDDTGYIQLDFGKLKNSTYLSKGYFETNEYKDIPLFNPDRTHLIWYFEFLWRIGLEYTNTKGNFATNSYDLRRFMSSYSETKMSLHYRFHKIFNNKLRLTLKLSSLANEFITQNDDNYLLSSRSAGMGMGARMSWEFLEPTWSTESFQPFAIQQIIYDYDIYPKYEVQDVDFPRGQSSKGSKITQWQLTVSTLVYLKWMIFFKRYVVDLSYGQSQSNLMFQGEPFDMTDSFSKIQSDGHYTESYNYFRVSIGLRMDDLLGRLLKPR